MVRRLPKPEQTSKRGDKKILWAGDSMSAGYGGKTKQEKGNGHLWGKKGPSPLTREKKEAA